MQLPLPPTNSDLKQLAAFAAAVLASVVAAVLVDAVVYCYYILPFVGVDDHAADRTVDREDAWVT